MSEETPEITNNDADTNNKEAPQQPKEEEAEKAQRIRIAHVAKDMTECPDCQKPMNKKKLRYSLTANCEKRPGNILDKPVRKNAPRTKIKVEDLAPKQEEVITASPKPPHNPQLSQPAPPKAKPQAPPPQAPPENPYANLTQSQLIQLQMRSMNAEIQRRKQEKADMLSKAMFQPRSKKK